MECPARSQKGYADMAEVFRMYLTADHPLLSDRKALRGFWELTCIAGGGKPLPGGLTVRYFSGRASVAGRAERMAEVDGPAERKPAPPTSESGVSAGPDGAR